MEEEKIRQENGVKDKGRGEREMNEEGKRWVKG